MKLPGQSLVYMDDSIAPVGKAGNSTHWIPIMTLSSGIILFLIQEEKYLEEIKL